MRKAIALAVVAAIAAMGLSASAKQRGGYRSNLGIHIAPYSVGIYDFYNGHDVEGARYLTATECALDLSASYGYRVAGWLSLEADAGYALAVKKDKDTIIPDGKAVQYADGMVGMAVHVPSDKADIYLGIMCGALYQHNVDYDTTTFAFGVKAGAMFPVSEHVWMGIEARGIGSYVPDDDELYASMTYIIDTCSASIAWRF